MATRSSPPSFDAGPPGDGPGDGREPSTGTGRSPAELDVPPPGEVRRRGARAGWARAEVAWPIGLAIGFLGTVLGMLAGVPGLAAAVASAGYMPVHARLIARRQSSLAGLTSIAWCLGIGGGIAGVIALGQDVVAVQRALPGAASFAASDLGFLLDPPVPGPAAGALLLRDLLVFTGLLVLARPLRGLLMLPGVALVTGAVGAGGVLWAPRLIDREEELASCAVQGWPPHIVVAGAGLLLAASALADVHPLRELARGGPAGSPGRAERRLLFFGGLLLGLAAIALGPFLIPYWTDWID